MTVIHTKCWCWLNNTWNSLLCSEFFFAICRLCHAHMRKDPRLSLLSHTANVEKLGGVWEQAYSLMILHWIVLFVLRSMSSLRLTSWQRSLWWLSRATTPGAMEAGGHWDIQKSTSTWISLRLWTVVTVESDSWGKITKTHFRMRN